jgi:hypothetical protein
MTNQINKSWGNGNGKSKGKGKHKGNGKGDSKRRSRFPSGMTDRKARATARANTGVLRFVQG